MFYECFVCKQKTAYELRISDCSSDVCSSDLGQGACVPPDQSGDRVAYPMFGPSKHSREEPRCYTKLPHAPVRPPTAPIRIAVRPSWWHGAPASTQPR